MNERPVLQPHFTFIANAISLPVTPNLTSHEPVCPWRPLNQIVVDGTAYFGNGWNRAFYADIRAGKLFPLGSTAPTSFAVTDAAGGSSMAAGAVRFYYFALRNDDRAEETAPQVDADGVAGYTYTMIGTKDRTITWEDPEDGRWTHAAIYVRRPNSDDVVKLAYVPIDAEVYTDTTADNALSTDILDTYVPRYRTDYPPRFKAFANHMGYVLAITGKDANVYFSQQVHPTGELTQTDFPAQNILAIEPDDGLGENVLVFSHYDATFVLKRLGCYIFEGDSPDTFAWRRMYKGRGAISARSVVSVNAVLALVDQLGEYAWSPGAEPQIVGNKGTGIAASPLAPTWQRMNRDAADMVHMTFKDAAGFVEARIPIDRSPVPKDRTRWNFRENRFESVDSLVSCAAGTWEDSSGVEHHVRLDDLGYAWEEDVGASEGCTAGATRGTRPNSSAALGAVGFPLASFGPNPLTGPHATLFELRNAAGVLLDTNRVYAATANVLTLLYWSPVAFASPQTGDVGCIPADVVFSQWDMGTADRKTVVRVIPRFRPQTTWNGTSPTLRVFSAPDERAMTLRRAVDMTGAKGWAAVPCWDRGYRETIRFESHRAGGSFLVQAMTIDLWATRVRV